METKNFKGKAIYQPSGKAAEYSQWACNFYVGCSNECEYCYCKKGILAKAMGGDKPTLKKCFRNIGHAKDVFEKEMWQNRSELKRNGLFLSFTTDPLLEETIELTVFALMICSCARIPVKILTKRVEWVESLIEYLDREFQNDFNIRSLIEFGFTLTGHDELEPNASTNLGRIEAMKKLHEAGFKTFASIEPIVDFDSSMRMIELSMDYCDLYKIGLMSGSKPNAEKLRSFVGLVNWYGTETVGFKVYWKESISKFFTTNSWTDKCCVSLDYNLFGKQ
jgi:DNA repair photolyase